MAKLTDKQKLFCHEYVIDCNGTQAAKRAGYSAKTAGSQAHDLLKKPEISKYIKSLLDRRAEKVQNTLEERDRTAQELLRRSMEPTPIYRDGELVEGKYECDYYVALKANDQLYKSGGHYKPAKLDVSGQMTLEQGLAELGAKLDE